MNDFKGTSEPIVDDFDDIIGANGPEAQAAAEARKEARRNGEVEAILKKTGVGRDEVENQTAPAAIVSEPVDDIPIFSTPTAKSKPVVAEVVAEASGHYPDPGPNWFDELGESYKIAREGADEASPEFVDFPTSLIRSAISDRHEITKRDVESVLAEFSMNVSLGQYEAEALALTVTDRSDKVGMKKARELRLVGKRERVRFDQQGVAIKEPLLRRTQLIDGFRRTVKRKFEAIEDHLLEQEEFEVRELAREAAERQVTRLAELVEFEWMITSTNEQREETATELKIGYMSDAEWLVFRNIAQDAYNERKEAERLAAEAKRQEDERLERENARLLKVNARVAELTKLGLNYDGTTFTCSEITINLADIEHATDEAFDRLMEKVVPRMLQIKDEEFAADQERNRLKVEAESERRKAAEAAAELKRIEDEKAAEAAKVAAEEERKRLAPDAEKLKDLENIIDAIALPTVDEKFHALMNEVASHLSTASGLLKTARAELEPTF